MLSALPTRFLQPGSIKMLHLQFCQERDVKVSHLAYISQQISTVLVVPVMPLWFCGVRPGTCTSIVSTPTNGPRSFVLPHLHRMLHVMIAWSSRNFSRWQKFLGQKGEEKRHNDTMTWLQTELDYLSYLPSYHHAICNPKNCMPYAAVIFEEPQFAYDVAKEYKEHVDSVRRDRSLEEFLEARLVKLIIIHISNPFRVEV